MAKISRRKLLSLSAGMLAASLPACALAVNGMYLTGYGSESVLMGGADVAVARDAFAANNNPAGMMQLAGHSAELELVAYTNQETSHTDSYGNYRKPYTKATGGFGNMAYAQRFENTPYAAGVAVVIQGGVGWTYSGLNTMFGTRDDASSLFAVLKLAPAFAWEVNDRLSLGVTLGVNYFGGAQELFPNTATNVPFPFNGFRFKDASGIGLNSKWGLQYRPAPDVTIGMTYGTQTSIPMKNGNLRMNFSNLGLGTVRYDDAKLEGFRLPEELAIGVSFRPTPPLLISLQEKWYNWSDALNTLQIKASNPRTPVPGALATILIPSTVGLVDQHVIEAGAAYDINKDIVLMAGINHGNRVMPDQNVNPIFALIPTRHYMLGLGYAINPNWRVACGMEVYTFQSATYDSPIFGPSANERHYSGLLHLSLGRRW